MRWRHQVERTGRAGRSHRSALFSSAVLATIAFAFLLLPMCQYLTKPCSPQNKSVSHSSIHSFSHSVMMMMKACFCTWDLNDHLLYVNPNILSVSLCFCQFFVLTDLFVPQSLQEPQSLKKQFLT